MPSLNSNGISKLERNGDYSSPVLVEAKKGEKKQQVEFLVTHDDIEYLSDLGEENSGFQEFHNVTESPETPLPPLSPMSQDYLHHTNPSKEKVGGEIPTPKGNGALSDSTIDQMIDELGIEL
jgi:hypothetical protein